ncbi:hypothetical protein EW145_g2346 [Phellinidium pouzarii]|uniref:Uncharacterized protein n=1 Tax=Phellinidium pouzarii TaxID=167371 RepID=A0A4S4LGQ1_9AGAM|nr:hypothetical protein EW145_g2346 [Phellinidium pouzarii]
MKLFTILAGLAIANVATAQGVSIVAPAENATLTPGYNVSVSVTRLDSSMPVTEIGIAIGLQHCTSTCAAAASALGSIFYSGSYNPQYGPGNPDAPTQDFSVTVPSGFQKGVALLTVAHASLVGDGPFFFTEIANVTVDVA